MPTLSELGNILIGCRLVSPPHWERAAQRGKGNLRHILNALTLHPPSWWSEGEGDEVAPPGLTDYQRGVIELWFESGGETDLARHLARNQFLLLDKLGQGGQGEVYRARQLNPGRFVAVKTLIQDSEQQKQRFEQEARVMMKIQHPSVARFFLYERVRDAGRKPTDEYLIAMEFVNGTDLSRLVDTFGAMPWPFVAKWAARLLDGLAVIHQNGFIHRDIKPANVMILGPVPEPDVPLSETAAKLLDFGAVKPASDAKGTGRRRVFVGTREYAPPEQWAEQTVPESDLYALGATLFHALTGSPPYQVEDRDAIAFMRAHTHAPIPSACKLNPKVPESVDELLTRMLAKEPDERGSAAELARKFRELLPSSDRTKSSPALTLPPVRPAKSASPRRQTNAVHEPEEEPKGPVHGLVHPLLLLLERMFIPSHLRLPAGHEPSLPERIANLLRRPVVLFLLVLLAVLSIVLVVK